MRPQASSIYGSEDEAGSSSRSFSIAGHVLTAPKPVPGLHLVATPIGNLADITLRALETLAGVDVIACEDTRITRRLTERYAITAALALYPEHNAAQARPKILVRLAQGAAIALVSGAAAPGTRWEYVDVLGPPPADDGVMGHDALHDLPRAQLGRGSVKDALAHAAAPSRRPRREVSPRALELAQTLGDGDREDCPRLP